jgi:hypothetical protein
MAKHYVIPSVSDQKGPTCWYYATKMLLKFHGVITDTNKPPEWQQLHEVRKAVTALSKTGGDRTTVNVKNLLYNEKPSANPNVKGAIDKLQNVPNFSHRFDIVAAFFGVLVKPAEITAWSAAGVETALTQFGPLYASIYSTDESGYSLANFFDMATTGNDKNVIDDPNQHGHLVYGLMGQGRSTRSRHAVLISGVNGDSIYYRDPNRPGYDTMESWDTFSGQLNSPGGDQFTGMKLFFYCDCTRGNGRCPHI